MESNLDPELRFYGEQIKMLGIKKIDNKLSFLPHTKLLKAKCRKALDIIKVVSSIGGPLSRRIGPWPSG